jgi:CHASE3 domain sensor protein
MNIFQGKRGTVSLGIATALLAAVVVLLWQQNRSLQRASASVAHNHEVRANLARLLSPVQDVQTGQRDYLLTGDARFLAAYNYGVSLIEPQYERVRRLTADNAQHRSALTSLKSLLDRHLATAKDSISLRDTAGLEAAQRDVLSGKGTTTMDGIRLAIHEMDRLEAAALARNTRAVRSAQTLINWLFTMLVATVAFSVTASYFTLADERRRTRLAEGQIGAAQNAVAAAHEELRNRTVMLQSILDSMSDGVAVADSEQKLLMCNPAGRQILDLGAQDTNGAQGDVGHGLYLSDQQTPLPQEQFPLTRAVRGDTIAGVEICARDATRATTQWFSATGGPLRSENGAVIGGVVVFQDVTTRKLMEPAHSQLVQQTETETSMVMLEEEIPDVFVSDVKPSAAKSRNNKAA